MCFGRKILILWLMLIAWPAMAADIQIQGNPGTVAAGQPFQLIFIVNGSQSGEPDFTPLSEHFDLLGTSTSSQFSMINGRTSQSKRYQMTLAARREGAITVPGITFGKDRSPEFKIEVTVSAQQPTPPGAQESGDEIRVIASVDLTDPWVQQQVLLKVKIYRNIGWQQARLSDVRYEGMDALVHQLGEDVQYQAELDGKSYQVIERTFTLFPQQSGELKIAPFTLTAALSSGRQEQSPFSGPFGELFSGRNTVQRVARSDAISIQVKPIPAEFKGTHWLAAREVRLQENWSTDTQTLTAGEPVTRTIALIADGISIGQLPEMDLPEVDGIRLYPEPPVTHEQGTADGLLSTSSRKFVLIPAKRGEYRLPELKVTWWNIATGESETARLPAHTLRTEGAAPVQEKQGTVEMPIATTVDETDATKEQRREKASDRDWLWWVIALIVGAVILLLWYSRKKPVTHKIPPSPLVAKKEEIMDNGKIWQQFDQACQRGDPTLVRDAVLIVGKSIWKDNPPVSLEDIGARVVPELAQALSDLNRHLYSQEKTTWDAELICKEFRRMEKSSAGEQQEAPSSGLEPLHP